MRTTSRWASSGAAPNTIWWRSAAIYACLVLLADLVSKWLAHTIVSDDLGPISPRTNDALALGLVGLDGPLPLVAAIVILAACVMVHAVILTAGGQLWPWLLGLGLGGAVANALDRSVTGAVHDFIHVGFAVANVADVAIVVFLIGYVVTAWRLAGDS